MTFRFCLSKYLDRRGTSCYILHKGGMNMSIAGDLIRGHTDAIILARLLRSDSYG